MFTIFKCMTMFNSMHQLYVLSFKYLANVEDVYNYICFGVTVWLMSLETLSTLAFLTIQNKSSERAVLQSFNFSFVCLFVISSALTAHRTRQLSVSS